MVPWVDVTQVIHSLQAMTLEERLARHTQDLASASPQAAVWALFDMSGNAENSSLLFSSPDLIPRLVALLDSAECRDAVASILVNVAGNTLIIHDGDAEKANQRAMMQVPDLVSKLVMLLEHAYGEAAAQAALCLKCIGISQW